MAKRAKPDTAAPEPRDVRLDIVEAMVLLEASKGHLGWKISELARAAGVARSLAYYHFGRTKREILETGIEIIAEQYFGMTEDRARMLDAGKGWDSVLQTRDAIRARPSFASFYLRWRLQPQTPFGRQLARIERRYQKMLRTSFPHLSEDEVVALHGILHSVVTAPFMTDASIDVVRRLLLRL